MAKKIRLFLPLLILLLMLLTILQDSLYASFNTTGFYFSESLLFTSFWWIFLPLLHLQYHVVSRYKPLRLRLFAVMAIPAIAHFILFPAFVWLISTLFFGHSFRFEQTFRFELASYLYVVLLTYSVPVLLFIYINRHRLKKNMEVPLEEPQKNFMQSLQVNDGNKIRNISVEDILYISANSPYIDICTSAKKYLHSGTLKAIAAKLDPDIFVRIHKSTIVNLREVETYKSRLNGDFDLWLKNGTQLRISRNYIGDFKNRFHGHRVAVI